MPDQRLRLASHRWVTGAHRADGLAGTARRYTVIVAFLVALASLPILAAIGAGSSTLRSTGPDQDTTPFIVEPPRVPVVVVPPPAPAGAARSGASPATGPWGMAAPIADRPRSSQAVRPTAEVRTPHRRIRVRHRAESTPARPAAKPGRPAAKPTRPAPAGRPGGCGRHRHDWHGHGRHRHDWHGHGRHRHDWHGHGRHRHDWHGHGRHQHRWLRPGWRRSAPDD